MVLALAIDVVAAVCSEDEGVDDTTAAGVVVSGGVAVGAGRTSSKLIILKLSWTAFQSTLTATKRSERAFPKSSGSAA